MGKRVLSYNTEDVAAGRVNVDPNGCITTSGGVESIKLYYAFVNNSFILTDAADGTSELTYDSALQILEKFGEGAVVRINNGGNNQWFSPCYISQTTVGVNSVSNWVVAFAWVESSGEIKCYNITGPST